MKYEENIFRLSAVLYADQNYNVSTNSIIKKIIESVYIDLDETHLSISRIIDYCEKEYSLQFDFFEIKKIVENEKDNSFTTYHSSDGELIVQLNEPRRQLILSKIENNSIDTFIEEYSGNKTIGKNSLKNLIYRFLYYIINNNQSSFIKLLNTSKQIDLPNVPTSINFSLEERKLINDFLNWDNDGKNKALFDILCYSVEYCLLVSDNRNSMRLDILKNKKFYLDTNIVYRIIGINGKERRKRTETFLKKCNEIGTDFFISKFTDSEFIDSIKNSITKMKRYGGKRVDSSLFYRYANNFDIYDFYYHWRDKRVNTSFIAFQNHILSLYEELKKRYKITIDYKIPFNLKEKEHKEIIDSYSTEIAYQKDANDVLIENSASYIDAENIYLIEQRRGNFDFNLSSAKFFMISTDQSLRKWDYQRSISTPTVIHPSQWLSIILRYVSRTLDDYKSFVSFLNIKAIETFKDNHTLHIIISAISETTEDLQKQNELVNVIVQTQFNNITKGHPSDDEIFQRTTNLAQKELAEKINEISTKYSALQIQLNEADSKIATLESKSQDSSNTISVLNKKNNKLKIQLKDKYIKEKLTSWKRMAYLSLILILILIVFYLFQIFFTSWNYNYPYKLIRAIDSLESEGVKTLLYGLNYALSATLLFFFRFIYKRLISKDSIKKFKDNIKIPSEYT